MGLTLLAESRPGAGAYAVARAEQCPLSWGKTCCLARFAHRGDEQMHSEVGRREINAGCYPVDRYNRLFIGILWASLLGF